MTFVTREPKAQYTHCTVLITAVISYHKRFFAHYQIMGTKITFSYSCGSMGICMEVQKRRGGTAENSGKFFLSIYLVNCLPYFIEQTLILKSRKQKTGETKKILEVALLFVSGNACIYAGLCLFSVVFAFLIFFFLFFSKEVSWC